MIESFAVDCWADRFLLLRTFDTERVTSWLASHRCQRHLTRIRSSWQLGPRRSTISFECVACSDHRTITVQTPFNLFEEDISSCLREGWGETFWEGRLQQWQEGHRMCSDEQFEILRRMGNNQLTLQPVCSCGMLGPGSSRTLSRVQMPAVEKSVPLPSTQVVPQTVSEDTRPDTLAARDRDAHFARSPQGDIYRLPRLLVLLEYAGSRQREAGTETVPIEQLLAEYERFEPPAEGVTWYDRLRDDID